MINSYKGTTSDLTQPGNTTTDDVTTTTDDVTTTADDVTTTSQFIVL